VKWAVRAACGYRPQVERADSGMIKDQEVADKAAVAFDLVRGDALPRSASQELILKVAESKCDV